MSISNAPSRKTIGFYLRDSRNLHYFAAIKPFLDSYLERAGIDVYILINEFSSGFNKEADYLGYHHLFNTDIKVRDCDLLITPSFLRDEDREGIDRNRTRLVQIFHGMSDKPFTYERNFSDYDLCLCIGQRQLDRMLRHEQNHSLNWRMVGYPKFDDLPLKKKFFANDKKNIIYCPTWRKGGLSSIEYFLDHPTVIEQLTSRYNLIVKPHPNIFNPDRICFDQAIVDRILDIPDITLARSGNVMPWLARSHLFIGDISATGYEWLIFGNPMVFLNPQPGLMASSEEVDDPTYLWRCGDVCDEINELPALIELNLNTDRYAQQRERLINYSVYRPRDQGATMRGIKHIDALLARKPSRAA